MKVSYYKYYGLNENYTLNKKLSPYIKNGNINFKSSDLLELSEKEIISKVKNSITPENYIGQGTNAEVYRIKGTDYCVRIPYLSLYADSYKFSNELSPIDKVNHVVAKLGYGTSIMKFFEGETPKDHKDNKLYRLELQQKIADMPLKSYTELLHQIANATDNEMCFDISGGNLIVDTKHNKLTAIDFFRLADNPCSVRPMNDIFSSLTSFGTNNEIGKQIFDKIFMAGIEEFKPDIIPCMDVELFDFEDLISRIFNKNTDNDKILALQKEFKELRQIKKAEIRNKNFSQQLKEKLSNIILLVKQLH